MFFTTNGSFAGSYGPFPEALAKGKVTKDKKGSDY